MTVTLIVGTLIFVISCCLSLLYLLGAISKYVGTTCFGPLLAILFLLYPFGLFAGELALCRDGMVGIAWVLIPMNLPLLVPQYLLLVNSAVFTRRSIYRLTKFLMWKRYRYDDVVGYVMKKTSGTVYKRFGPRTVVTYDVEIYFNDNQYADFSVKDESSRKVRNIKRLLEEHHCHRNGRIKRKAKTRR